MPILLLLGIQNFVQAEVRTLVLSFGNNQGVGRDVPLRYAESDAEKVSAVFSELGLSVDHIITLLGKDAQAYQKALGKARKQITK